MCIRGGLDVLVHTHLAGLQKGQFLENNQSGEFAGEEKQGGEEIERNLGAQGFPLLKIHRFDCSRETILSGILIKKQQKHTNGRKQ